jgi:hypothetical protein
MSERDILAEIRAVARGHGYAVAVHGSQARDLDLIAAPWTSEAVDPLVLVDALCDEVGLRPRLANVYPDGSALPNPEFKPHGRLAWSLVSNRGPLGYAYLDLSVAPKAGTALPMFVAAGYRELAAPGERTDDA